MPPETHTAVKPQHIAIVASLTLSLVNFRYQLLKAMVTAGHRVTAFAPEADDAIVKQLDGIGVQFIQIPMARTGLNPLQDAQTVFALYRHFRRLKPDVVLPYTMKPIIYGSLSARLAGVSHRFALFTGMGHVFSDANPSGRARLVRWISIMLYRISLRGTRGIFLYNSADEEDVKTHRLVESETFMCRVSGSGIDLEQFPSVEPVSNPVTFLLIARMLRDKGIPEFVAAARQIRKRHQHVRFQLLGPLEPHKSSITRDELDIWTREGIVEYLGETRDVRPFLAQSSVFVLPSTYREGIPRSILEALATGRAIITTDAPGCSDTVIEGVNGFLIPPHDAKALASAMEKFLLSPDLINKMGQKSLEMARSKFDVHAINRLLLERMNLAPVT